MSRAISHQSIGKTLWILIVLACCLHCRRDSRGALDSPVTMDLPGISSFVVTPHTGRIFCGFYDGRVARVDIEKQEIQYVGRCNKGQDRNESTCVAVTRNGESIAASGFKKLWLWSNNQQYVTDVPLNIDQLLISPDNKRLIIKGWDRRIYWYDCTGHTLTSTYEFEEIPLRIRYGLDENYLLAIFQEKAQLLRVDEGRNIKVLHEFKGTFRDAAFVDSLPMFALCDAKGQVQLCDSLGKNISSLDLGKQIVSVGALPDEKVLVLGTLTGQVVCVSFKEGILKKEWFVQAAGGLAYELAISDNGKFLIVRSDDKLLEFDFKRIRESKWRNY